MMHSKNIFRAARAQLSFYLGGDASENGDFQMGKQRLQGYKNFPTKINDVFKTFSALRAPSFHFIWGAMRQKMAIFKWENSVAGVQKFSELSFFKSNFIKMFKNLWGAMWPKIVILLKEKWSHMASFSIFEIKVYKTF